jgi:hypothetical protein
MKTPSSPSTVPTPSSSGSSWTESLKNQTREALEECRINPATNKLHLKNINGNFGHITLQDLLARRLHVYSYENSDEYWTGECVEDLLAAGWAID